MRLPFNTPTHLAQMNIRLPGLQARLASQPQVSDLATSISAKPFLVSTPKPTGVLLVGEVTVSAISKLFLLVSQTDTDTEVHSTACGKCWNLSVGLLQLPQHQLKVM